MSLKFAVHKCVCVCVSVCECLQVACKQLVERLSEKLNCMSSCEYLTQFEVS